MFKNYKEEVEALKKLLDGVGVPYEIFVYNNFKRINLAANIYCTVWINGKEYMRNSNVGKKRFIVYTKRGATYEKIKRLLRRHGLISF